MKAYIEHIGLQAPGLEGWEASQAILKGEEPYAFAPLSKYSPQFLPANERRRTTSTIKLALRTAEETVSDYTPDAIAAMPTLFACVDGDTEISAKMTSAILQDQPMVSPIHFHNSVHNAPAGYWMIGQQNHQAATAISAGEYQIANSFIEALTQLSDKHPKVLLVVYDLPIDPIIESHQPKRQAFAFGLVLSRHATENSQAWLELSLHPHPCPTPVNEDFGDNVAAGFWPLLAALAKRQTAELHAPASASLSAHLKMTPVAQVQGRSTSRSDAT